MRKAAVFSILTCEELREKSDEKEEIRPACCVVIWSQHNRLGDAIFVVMVVENARADRSMEPTILLESSFLERLRTVAVLHGSVILHTLKNLAAGAAFALLALHCIVLRISQLMLINLGAKQCHCHDTPHSSRQSGCQDANRAWGSR